MRSGVYCLTFKDGSCYVGKSIDIERRWKEHAEKFKSGKAAKNMQAAFNSYGYPNAKVLLECHSDHIDLMETYYIGKLQPQLNTIGGIYVDSEELKVLEKHSSLLECSTATHLYKIISLQQDTERLNKKYLELKEFLDEEKHATALGEELYEMSYKVEQLQEDKDAAEYRIAVLEQEINKPWWKRIFS